MPMDARGRVVLGLVVACVSSACSSNDTSATLAPLADSDPAVSIEISSGTLVPTFSEDVHDYELTSFTTLQDVSLTVGYRTAHVLGATTMPGVPMVLPTMAINAGAVLVIAVDGAGKAPAETFTIHLQPKTLPTFTTVIDAPEPGKIFLTPFPFLGTGPQPYLMTVSTSGDVLAYTSKPAEISTDLKRHVLPDGTVQYSYLSAGAAHLFDAHMTPIRDYTLLATARHAAQAADNHDIHVLGDDHVVIEGYVKKVVTNIPSAIAQTPGGSKVTAAVIQEIDHGQVVFEWDSTDFPELYGLSTDQNVFTDTDTYVDYAHLNSLFVDPSTSNLVVSFRHLDCVLSISRPAGAIVWRLGGPGDTFGTTQAQKSSHQHFASVLADGRIMMFDNGFIEKASRVLTFGLDFANPKVTSFESLPLGYFGSFLGSAQPVGKGSLLVGLGASQPGQPDVVMFDRASGKKTFTLTLGAEDYYSYRAQWEDGVGR